MDWIAPILATIVSPVLEVKFVLAAIHDDESLIEEWKEVDRVLAGMKLQRLKVVVDATKAYTDMDDVSSFVMELVPSLVGVLEVLSRSNDF